MTSTANSENNVKFSSIDNYHVRQQARQIASGFKDYSFKPNKNGISSEEMTRIIDTDINVAQQKTKKWKNLLMCYKWTLIKQYLEKCNVTDPEIVKKFEDDFINGNGLNDVEYDAITNSIIKLNYKDI